MVDESGLPGHSDHRFYRWTRSSTKPQSWGDVLGRARVRRLAFAGPRHCRLRPRSRNGRTREMCPRQFELVLFLPIANLKAEKRGRPSSSRMRSRARVKRKDSRPGVFSLFEFAANWCFFEYPILFLFGWLRGVITKLRMTDWPLGLPLLVIHRFSPRRGSYISAQGRAERRSRVAPPWVRRGGRTPALKGRNKPCRS